jgi:phospholipase C
VFDHTSVGQFIEKRFGVSIPGISPWHRAVCGDLTSAFDFKKPNELVFPDLPRVTDSSSILDAVSKKPKPVAPDVPQAPVQERGTRKSRALPYDLSVHSRLSADGWLSLAFVNSGTQGAVFHVYDKLHLDRIPRRYTVEAKKRLTDSWKVGGPEFGGYHLWVYGPNGFVREFRGAIPGGSAPRVEIKTQYDWVNKKVSIAAQNLGKVDCRVSVKDNAYGSIEPQTFALLANKKVAQAFSVAETGGWYDLTVATAGFERRVAGRMEIGDSISDPAMGT